MRPVEADVLVQRDGVQAAEMRGKAMSPGWLRVDIDALDALDALDDDAILHEWIDVAVAHAEQRANAS